MYNVSAVTIAWFALAWFVVGVVAGHGLQVVAPRKKRSSRRSTSGKRKRSDSSDRGDRGDRRDRRDRVVSGDQVEIYIGNLPYGVSKKDISGAFGEFGAVSDIRIIRSKNSGKSRGYGFIVMDDRRAADKAIKAMSGKDFKGRALVCNEAKSRAR